MEDDPEAPVFRSWDDTAPEQPSLPPPAPIAPAEVDFLTPQPPNSLLLGADIYRPTGMIALALLLGPTVCAIVGAIATRSVGAIPLWLPLALLGWLPILALAWASLKSVRVTAEALSCGRPLGAWRTLGFAEITRVEQRGPRMVVKSRFGARLSFTPSLLRRGANLRRRLLLQLPLETLAGDLRAEAVVLEGADTSAFSATNTAANAATEAMSALTVRVATRWTALAFALALAALIGAGLAFWLLASTLSVALVVALVALAGMLTYLGLWIAQELLVTEHGFFVHYRLLRRDRDIFWSQARRLEYAPAALALRLRGDHDLLCAGPGLFTRVDAQALRERIRQYTEAQSTPLLARPGA